MPEFSSRPLLDTRLDLPLFVDRERELAALQRSVESGLNALVLADRGAGKTSLLHYLVSTIDETRFEPVFLDGTRAASGVLEFLSLIVFEIEVDGSRFDQVVQALPALNRRAPTSQSQRLLVALREVEDILRRRERRVVLLVDGPPSAEDAYTLFGRLRDELWRLPATWVLAGDTDEAATYLREPANAFFETIVRMDPLSDEDAAELLVRRTSDISLSKALLKEIVSQAEGNPRRLLSLARDAILSDKLPEQLSAERAVREQASSQLGEAARRLLAELEAQGRASASDERLLARLGWTRSRATQVFRELERAGLVRASLERSGPARPRKVYEVVGDTASEAWS
jgi:hypothetical protein